MPTGRLQFRWRCFTSRSHNQVWCGLGAIGTQLPDHTNTTQGGLQRRVTDRAPVAKVEVRYQPPKSLTLPTRHAGEGRYLRLLFVAARKAVDTGLRRHDDVCGAGGSILRIPG